MATCVKRDARGNCVKWKLGGQTVELRGLGEVTIFVKGGRKTATRAAERHGMSARSCTPKSHGETVCEVPCSKATAVARWFGERGTRKSGRGYAPGDLVHYASRDCGGLAGVGKRRRKRKR